MSEKSSAIKKLFSKKNKENSCCSFEIEEIKECCNDKSCCDESDKTEKDEEKK
ncbi:hypothetical protein ACTPDI_17675 [Clostridioides difficile]|uniref:hypothetical protein n=1 Tax=Clostridioides sp. ZZV15-6598 TaxID=2811501 RepID=UPI001D117160|nr:hypothetical protein [Clostridioides sp. ZZV15-6598]